MSKISKMTVFLTKLNCLLVFAVLMTTAKEAFALGPSCTGPLPSTVNIPSFTVHANLAVGEPIPGARASFNIPINCKTKPNGEWYITSFATSVFQVKGFTNVYTVAGMGKGVGFRIRNASGAVVIPRSYQGSTNSFDMGPATRGTSSVQGTFELVKTGDVQAGAFRFQTFVHVPDRVWANGANSADSALNFSYKVQGTIVSTCSVATPTVAVALPDVPRAAFKGPGSTAGAKAFAIGLQCEDSAKPSIALTDVAATDNTSNALTLSPNSTATGVGVQIVYQSQPLPLGPMTALGSRSGSTSVEFQAQYVQTASNVNPGSVNAAAVFNLNYN